MSHVKLFATITDSSMWDMPDSVCKIWITMLSMADWHGNIYASLPGLANRARKTIPEVEAALEVFRGPDKYSRTSEFDGRRIIDIDGGWLLLNYKKHRDARNVEALRESKRVWAQKSRSASKSVEDNRTTTTDPRTNHSVVLVSDLDLVLAPEGMQGEDSGAESGDVPHAYPAPEQFPDDPELEALSKKRILRGNAEHAAYIAERRARAAALPEPGHDCEAAAVETQGQRRVYRSLTDWEPSESLIAQALTVGLTMPEFSERLAELRNGPIGGVRGVYDREEYVRRLLPKWRTWHETARAKAALAAANPSGRAPPAGTSRAGWAPNSKHKAFAKRHDLDVGALAAEYINLGAAEKRSIADANRDFGLRLDRVAKGGTMGLEAMQ